MKKHDCNTIRSVQLIKSVSNPSSPSYTGVRDVIRQQQFSTMDVDYVSYFATVTRSTPRCRRTLFPIVFDDGKIAYLVSPLFVQSF